MMKTAKRMLLPLQGGIFIELLPRVLPWAMCRLPFQGASCSTVQNEIIPSAIL